MISAFGNDVFTGGFFVRETESEVAAIVGAQKLQILKQTHSKDVHFIKTPIKNILEGDALVTKTAGLALAVYTADCAPVLLSGHTQEEKPIIGAAHAGWRGAVGGVLEEVVDVMLKNGAELNSLKAEIGPCITQPSYEVSCGFENPFIKEDEMAEKFFKESSQQGKLHFDLPGYVAYRLARVGLKSVKIDGRDTFSSKEFYSFRRATLKKEKNDGRQLSTIMIKNAS